MLNQTHSTELNTITTQGSIALL